MAWEGAQIAGGVGRDETERKIETGFGGGGAKRRKGRRHSRGVEEKGEGEHHEREKKKHEGRQRGREGERNTVRKVGGRVERKGERKKRKKKGETERREGGRGQRRAKERKRGENEGPTRCTCVTVRPRTRRHVLINQRAPRRRASFLRALLFSARRPRVEELLDAGGRERGCAAPFAVPWRGTPRRHGGRPRRDLAQPRTTTLA